MTSTLSSVLIILLSLFSMVSCTHQQTENLPDPLEAGWKGEKVCEVLYENEKQRVLRCTFPPGVGHEKHFHAPHFGYTLKGGTFQMEDEEGVRTVEVPTGYDFYNEEVIIHNVLNVGKDTAVFLIVEPK